jgi:hypothetical protein
VQVGFITIIIIIALPGQMNIIYSMLGLVAAAKEVVAEDI